MIETANYYSMIKITDYSMIETTDYYSTIEITNYLKIEIIDYLMIKIAQMPDDWD
jgi:hypothetical protein